MPTGYTADLADGKDITFQEFAMKCARAFGACIDMREEPSDAEIPQVLQPRTSYHDEKLADAKARLERLMGMTPAQVENDAAKAHAEASASWRTRMDAMKAQMSRYEDMLAKVEAWKAPTVDHDGLKAFMAEQLRTSIQCDIYNSPPPVAKSAAGWLADELRSAEHDLNYHTQHRAEEIARTASRNQWLAELRVSLGLATAYVPAAPSEPV